MLAGFVAVPLVLASGCDDPDAPPAGSPDRPILFTGSYQRPDGLPSAAIYSVRADGTGLTKLSPGLASDRSPEWSPDGTKIAFVIDTVPLAGLGNAAVHQINADGSNPRLLVFPGGSCRGELAHISWSPDGRRLALGCEVEVLVYELSTDSMSSVRGVAELIDFGDWSPNGQKLVYESQGDQSIAGLIIANPDGTGQVPFQPVGLYPAWSPDGKRIAYANGPTFRTSIYIANIDGSGVRRVTTPPDSNYRDEYPAWSPDGTRLVFHRFDFTPGNRPQRYVVYVVNVDGSGLHRVSPDSIASTRPTW